MIYVEVCRSSAALSLSLQVGARMQLAGSAIGRAYLVRATEQERKDILSRSLELDEEAYQNLRQALDKALRDHEQIWLHYLVRRLAEGRQRHRGRLPADRR